jgi:ABC-type thiamine transport system substrate-binding protein
MNTEFIMTAANSSRSSQARSPVDNNVVQFNNINNVNWRQKKALTSVFLSFVVEPQAQHKIACHFQLTNYYFF